jgi:putative transposase
VGTIVRRPSAEGKMGRPDAHRKAARDTPRVQRTPARTLAHWLSLCSSREEALYRAHTEGAVTMTVLAGELGLSVSRISRLIAKAEVAAERR